MSLTAALAESAAKLAESASDCEASLNEPDICVFKAKELVTLLIDPEIAFFKAP